MRVKERIELRGLSTIELGSHFGIPAARFLEGSVVKVSYLGPRAEQRAWKYYASRGE